MSTPKAVLFMERKWILMNFARLWENAVQIAWKRPLRSMISKVNSEVKTYEQCAIAEDRNYVNKDWKGGN
jgi:hypothetical protein